MMAWVMTSCLIHKHLHSAIICWFWWSEPDQDNYDYNVATATFLFNMYYGFCMDYIFQCHRLLLGMQGGLYITVLYKIWIRAKWWYMWNPYMDTHCANNNLPTVSKPLRDMMTTVFQCNYELSYKFNAELNIA